MTATWGEFALVCLATAVLFWVCVVLARRAADGGYFGLCALFACAAQVLAFVPVLFALR